MSQEVCVICGSEADNECYYCRSAYCNTHYEKVVMSGNCCRHNEEDYN